MVRQSLKEKLRKTREDAIVDAARELISQRGYSAMSMDDLAAEVGISKTTLYQHFPSKEELAVSVVTRIMASGIAFLDAQPAEAPAAQRLVTFLSWVMETRYGERRLDLGAAKVAVLPFIKAHPRYQEVFGQITGRLVDLMEQAKRDGAMRASFSAQVAVRICISLLRDADFEDLIAEGKCTAREVGETLSTVVLDGMRAPNAPGRAGER